LVERRFGLDLKKRVFWGEEMHDRDECDGPEKKYKRACETPKIYENAQIFRSELRVARGMRG